MNKKNRNPNIFDAVQAFEAINQNGLYQQLRYTKSTDSGSHFQGIAKYGSHYITVRDTIYGVFQKKRWDSGIISCFSSDNGSLEFEVKTGTEHCNHPGGIQVIGDYLITTNEYHYGSAYYHTKIALHTFQSEEKVSIVDSTIIYDSELHSGYEKLSSTAVGITHYLLPNSDIGWLVVNYASNGKIMFFVNHTGNITNQLQFVNEISIDDFPKSYTTQNIGLFTDKNNNMYIVLFASKEANGSYEDRMFLYQIINSGGKWEMHFLKDRHLVTVHPNTTDTGVHCRYGCGLIIYEDRLNLIACEKNASSRGNFDINIFI